MAKKEKQQRVLNTPIDAGVYDKANMARVASRLSWRQVVEAALAAYVEKTFVGKVVQR